MPEMHTLVLNGQAYQLHDKTAARLDNETVGDGAWSGKNIIDRLCPAFSEDAGLVSCDPVEGYPLEIVTHIPAAKPVTALTLRHTGKNLWNFKSGVSRIDVISGVTGKEIVRYGYILRLPAGEYTISGQILSGENYLYFNPIQLESLVLGNVTHFITPSGVLNTTVQLQEGQGLCFYNAHGAATLETTQKAFYEDVNIQIEAGAAHSPYEPFWGEEKTVTFLTPFSGDYRWENQAAQPGRNCIYSSAGATRVSGRLDLITLLQEGGYV